MLRRVGYPEETC